MRRLFVMMALLCTTTLLCTTAWAAGHADGGQGDAGADAGADAAADAAALEGDAVADAAPELPSAEAGIDETGLVFPFADCVPGEPEPVGVTCLAPLESLNESRSADTACSVGPYGGGGSGAWLLALLGLLPALRRRR